MFYPPFYLACLAVLTALSACTVSGRVTLLLLGSFLFICVCALADMVAHLP